MRFQLAAFADEADGALAKQITAMKENGIDYLEIRGVDGKNISNLTNEEAKEIKKRLDDAGLGVWSLGSPYGKIGIEDDFAPHLDLYCHGLELAELLGAKHIRLFSFYIPQGKVPEDYRNAVIERMAQFDEKAKGYDVILCHENEKGIYGENAARCLEIHKALPNIKAVFDPANFIQSGQDTKEAWKMLVPYVEYMHIKDALSDGLIVPAGKGEGEFPYLLSQYQGKVLTLEPHLTVFDGLAELEQDGHKSQVGGYQYPSARVAFDAAVMALKELIK